MSSSRRSPRHAFAKRAIDVVIVIVLVLLMINVVFPWAAGSLADGFITVIERAR